MRVYIALMASRRILLLGAGDLTDETCAALEAAGGEVVRLEDPSAGELRGALGRGADAVAVVSRDDAWPLRAALLVRHLDADVPIVATIFDAATGRELEHEIDNVAITSLADIVAPSLAGPCLRDDLAAVLDGERPSGVRCEGGNVEVAPLPEVRARRARALATAILRPFDRSAALLFFGAVGLVFILVAETVAAAIVLDQSLVDAFYGAVKTLVTVDPNPAVQDGPDWFKVAISASMLVALLFAAAFTGGLVERLIGRNLTGLLGRRAVPRSDHERPPPSIMRCLGPGDREKRRRERSTRLHCQVKCESASIRATRPTIVQGEHADSRRARARFVTSAGVLMCAVDPCVVTNRVCHRRRAGATPWAAFGVVPGLRRRTHLERRRGDAGASASPGAWRWPHSGGGVAGVSGRLSTREVGGRCERTFAGLRGSPLDGATAASGLSLSSRVELVCCCRSWAQSMLVHRFSRVRGSHARASSRSYARVVDARMRWPGPAKPRNRRFQGKHRHASCIGRSGLAGEPDMRHLRGPAMVVPSQNVSAKIRRLPSRDPVHDTD
jgi:hypothetical protein